MKQFFSNLWNAIIRFFKEQTTEEKIYEHLKRYITVKEIEALEEAIVIAINDAAKNGLTDQWKRRDVMASVRVKLSEFGDGVKDNMKDHLINYLIEKKLAEVKLHLSK